MIAPGLPVSGYEFVERPPLADRHHVEARFAKGLQATAGVGQEVDGAILGCLARGLDTRSIAGAVALCGPGCVDPFRPDDVGVAIPGSAEGVHEGEVSPP